MDFEIRAPRNVGGALRVAGIDPTPYIDNLEAREAALLPCHPPDGESEHGDHHQGHRGDERVR